MGYGFTSSRRRYSHRLLASALGKRLIVLATGQPARRFRQVFRLVIGVVSGLGFFS